MNLSNIKFYIVDKNKDIVEILKYHFSDVSNVEILRGDIVDTVKVADCIVAGNNSYGLMDSGADKKINYILNNIQTVVKAHIESFFYGELSVGKSIILKTDSKYYKYLAYCPNMRIKKNVSNTENAYVAFRALLQSIIEHNKTNDDKILSVVCTGFCTGSGKMDPNKAGKHMRLAYGFMNIKINCSHENATLIDKLLN